MNDLKEGVGLIEAGWRNGISSLLHSPSVPHGQLHGQLLMSYGLSKLLFILFHVFPFLF